MLSTREAMKVFRKAFISPLFFKVWCIATDKPGNLMTIPLAATHWVASIVINSELPVTQVLVLFYWGDGTKIVQLHSWKETTWTDQHFHSKRSYEAKQTITKSLCCT